MKLKQLYYQIVKELRESLKQTDLSPDFLMKPVTDHYNITLPKKQIPRELPEEQLLLLKKSVSKCEKCQLSLKRTNTVFGFGPSNADIMFIGEGPGKQEDLSGDVFVGPAGQLLTKIIENGIKIPRKDVYITNIVKCRPPNNRNPQPNEVYQCINFLYEEIKLIQPKLIILLGAVALKNLLPAYPSITRYHGQELTLMLNNNSYPVIPIYHPSYLLRFPEKKRETWEDVKTIIAKVASFS